ncbi:hypothetical protein DPMN_183604 [Dreissena polymorpha]|uniref:Uncharacterized protein n=1 Tax=Dreissena polymorpha TaxID=45954 RepID=A0A9D4DHQ2_DREPO|nr:hypothetical protein DPMN_194790 [Dreissena polymorpha]KAH3749113.1 hypothetical protein DPMN_183604 [Dreissena polymorpha]
MMEILIDATTSELESFNNHLLIRSKPKRNAFRRKKVYSKAACNWSTRPVKKTYITGLITEVINEFTIGKKRISGKCEQLPEDSKRIRSTIAPVTPPPTSILGDQHVSRLRKAKK